MKITITQLRKMISETINEVSNTTVELGGTYRNTAGDEILVEDIIGDEVTYMLIKNGWQSTGKFPRSTSSSIAALEKLLSANKFKLYGIDRS